MGRPYTMDLRDRVVASVVKEGLSRRAAAARFNVGVSTVIVWVRRFLKTGDLAIPRAYGAEYVVLDRLRTELELDLPVVYEDGRFVVYRF